MHRIARWQLLVGCFAVCFLLIAADPPQPQIQTAKTKRPIIGAWLRAGSPEPMRQLVVVLATHVRAYDEISAFSYTVEPNGTLTANNPVNDAVLVDFARANDIRVIPTVSSTWDSRNILAMLKDSKTRARHIEAIMKVARSPLIDGIDIDYENLPPEMRQPFTDFIYELSIALHAENKILSVTVPARVRNDDGCQVCAFADYANLGRAADQIRIMAYEYHGKTGGPGANAPVWWLRQVTEYAVSQVPREKIILGIHLYGYDWGGKETPALWWADVQARKDKYGGVSRYIGNDERGAVGETVLTYNVIVSPRCPPDFFDCAPYTIEKHTVWYVDANYVKLAWQIINDYNLGGMVMWRPGGEDPAMWEYLEQ